MKQPLRLEYRVRQPQRRRYTTPLLLLHGAWHGAWCWQGAIDDFAQRGFEVHTCSLRGHGASDRPRAFNLIGVADYVRDLAMVVDAIQPKPVVIAHSMGGAVLQHYMGHHQLPGGVLLCSLPITSALPFLWRYLNKHPLPTLGALLNADMYRMVGTPALARDAFFRHDIPVDELHRYAAQLGPESFRAAVEFCFGPRPDPKRSTTPVLVIAAERDRVFTIDEERTTAAAFGAELVIVPDASHDLMLDPAWPVAADAIERFAARGE